MMIFREYGIIATVTLGLLLVNSFWGLPNSNRLTLLGGSQSVANHLSAIKQAKTQAKKIGTTNLSDQDRIHFALREFLISPFAGDDNFTLNAIRNLNPYKLKLDPHFYIYGGGFIYTGAFFLQVSAWLGYTHLISDVEFYLLHPEELGKIFAVLRFMVAIFASAGILLTYHLARSHYNTTTAQLTALFMLSVPLIHQTSRAIEPHIFVVPFFITAFIFITSFAQKLKRKHLVLAAVFSGFSVGIQVLSGYIAVAFFTALFILYQSHRINIRQIVQFVLFYGLIAAIAGFAINPYYLLNFDGFMQDFNRGTSNQLLNAFKFWAPYQISLFLLLLCLITPVFYLFKHQKDIFSKLALPCIFVSIPIYIFIANYHMPYIITIIPLVGILCVRMLQDTFYRLTTNTRTFFVIFILLCFLVSPIARSAYYILNFTSQNREEAGAWINDNIPHHATIAIRFPPSVWDCVPFQFYNHTLVDYRNITAANLPEYAVLSNVELPETISHHYEVSKIYKPQTIFGYAFKLEGELHALIGKTIRIYKRKTPNPS